MTTLFQKVSAQYAKKLPFVVYCKPNSDTFIGVFQPDDGLHSLTDFTESGFAFVSFDGSEKYYIPSESSDVVVERIIQDDFYFSNTTPIQTNPTAKKEFELLVQSGIDAIVNGAFKKVVLSRKELVEIANLDIEQLMKNLQFNYPTSFNSVFFHPKIGFWIGATPEQLLQVNDDKVNTVALAGTQVFSEGISWQNKEKEEQAFVTDFIVQNLNLYCTSVAASEPYTFRAGNLVHIKTDIRGVLNSESDLGKLIDKLHPTPAVCGLPKEAAKQFILDNEKYDRKFYTGFLGELNIDFTTFRRDTSDLFVNLRCMELEGTNASVYVGCGITKDSIPEKEYIETVNKSMTIRKVVNLNLKK